MTYIEIQKKKSPKATLIVLGNGFDLAQGLATSYWDFIVSYMKFIITEAYLKLQQPGYVEKLHQCDLFTITNLNNRSSNKIRLHGFENRLENLNTPLELLRFGRTEFGRFELREHAYFIRYFSEDEAPPSWGDIEYQFYKAIEEIYNNYLPIKGAEKEMRDKLIGLNNTLDFFIEKFKEYLKEQLKIIPEVKTLKHIFNTPEEFDTEEDIIIILNFNYTETFKHYLSSKQKSIFKCINIHGDLKNESNPPIFGLGDEYSGLFALLKDTNEDLFLENIKSNKYLRADQYEQLITNLSIVDSVDVRIVGHSCSLSDRTLLKEIFNLEKKDVKIDVYHYSKQLGEDKGLNDYTRKLYGLSRYFDNNQIMRSKVNRFNENKRIPQYDDKNHPFPQV